MVLKIQKTASTSGIQTNNESNLEQYGLGGVNCDICNNTGYVVRRDENGVDWSRECVCMKARRSLRSLKTSGLMDMVDRYTFLNYQTPDESRTKIKERAIAFCDEPEGWFYITGQPGSGKTHICTAICSEFIKNGRTVKYMLWRDEIVQLKALQMDQEEYNKRMWKLKTVSVLYIDDFLKCRGAPSDSDINIAFELLNARYNNTKLTTIISTERSISEILGLDEALGSRIVERCKGYCIKAASENWRLRQ